MKTETSLKPYNTFGIDAQARQVIIVEHKEELDRILPLQRPYYILGGGSNIVVHGNYPGTVVVMRNKGIRLLAQEAGIVRVEAQAGEVWDAFVRHCIAHGWHGAENLSAIPGTVGAAPVQNVGAYGAEAKDIIEEVRATEIATGRPRTFRNEECRLAYRSSIFKNELAGQYIITSVVFCLSTQFRPNTGYEAVRKALEARGLQQPTARQLADVITEVRWAKLPRPEETGSAGSFFKNPVVCAETYLSLRERHPDLPAHATDDGGYKISAGWLIEQAGWKGRSLGRAAVWDKQALVLVNAGGASGGDILRLANAIADDVRHKFGITIEKEAIEL